MGPTLNTKKAIQAEEVHGYSQKIDGKNTFICPESAEKLAAHGRLNEVLEKALSTMGSAPTREPTIVVQQGVHALLQNHPRILEQAISGLRDIAHGELAPKPIVIDRNSTDREWTYHYLVELRPDANAIVIRRAIEAELGHIVEKTPDKDGFRRDNVGIFPRFTIGEDKEVFAFVTK